MIMGVTAHAQERTINGIVTDESGLPFPGVNVTVKGKKESTQTDFDGKYSIKALRENLLIFSYLGYKTKSVKVESSNTINITLEPMASQLDEMVVIGYNRVSRTSSKSKLERQKKKAYHQGIAQAIQGQVTGVHISSGVGAPGSKIKIRGVNGIGNKGPLYIVDGVPIKKEHNSIVANIDPKSIDKINIYKKAQARQLFGASAKHGCIVITTKKGTYQIENEEAYAQINENSFEKVTLNPLSTFSIDVDKASYSNIRRMINGGVSVPVDAVKIEEMVNYFGYSYPQPKEHPFSINTELSTTPWNKETKMVKIGLQGKTYMNDQLPPSNLTFLIDVSGSMASPNKLPLLKSAFRLLVNQLREKDKVSIVVYAGAAGVVLKPTNGDNTEKIINALDHLEVGGSTAGGEGIELAYQLAVANFKKKGNNRVILATDGDFNVGASSDKEMEALIEEKRKSGIFLSVLGFGMGNLKDSKLETLADTGNGNHAYIDTMQEAQKVFGEEFGGTLYTIAKDVKIQVEFNPEIVQAYRLIGYENRLLDDEDFVDDTKDAGELGSGHTVTALYEIIPIGVKSEYLKDVADLKYTSIKKSTTFSDELLTVKFRYKKPSGTKSIEMTHIVKDTKTEMSPDFKFASAVALFGMHLRKSQYTNNTTINDIVTLAEAGRKNDRSGYRSEFIRLVKTVKNNL